MIIPVRCYSCGKTMAHLYEPYRKLLDEDYTEAEALQAVGAVRYCCRRMLLSHIDLIEGLMPYSSPVVGTMQRLRTGNTTTSSSSNQQPTTSGQNQQQQQNVVTTSSGSGSSGGGSAVSAPSTKRNALQ